MPELPEVETVKRELERAIIHKKIVDIVVNNPKVIRESRKREFVKKLRGAIIKNILRKGKLLILELSTGNALTVHLKMTGQLVYPGFPEKARVSFKLSNGKFLDFRDARLFGELRLLKDWRSLKFIRQLGPEPFDISQAQFSALLAKKKTKIKPLLLDQTFISGVGNLYAAEALFRAKIHPARPANSLSDKEKKKLFESIKYILREAIKHKGSSVDQYVQLNGKRGDYVRFHKVYARDGKPCQRCGADIKRVSMGGRGTYFCPRCQK